MKFDKCNKKSFLKFDFSVNVDKLVNDFNRIGISDWSSSYWGNVHCSVGMLLLRGGKEGGPQDFYADTIYDQKILSKLKYIEFLISDDGPFGEAKYAFLFKTKPKGITLKHRDLMDCWRDMYRIHIPIITNSGAFLISNEYSMHLSVGNAWTFDNHTDHGVVNGDFERTHLIFDVPINQKVQLMVENASFYQGEIMQKNISLINQKDKEIESYKGDIEMKKAIEILRSRAVSDEDIANFFNSKKIPSKEYPIKKWDKELVANLLPMG